MSNIDKASAKPEKEKSAEFKVDRPSVRTLPQGFPVTRLERHETGDEPEKLGAVTSNQQLISLFQPGSLAAEQFRKLRTHLFRSKFPDPPKTILVTSAMSGEGKTFVAMNLAVGIAYDLHAHALLVDCDLRKPALAHLFGLHNGEGLSDYLKGDRKISELLMRTEVEKLSILPSGTIQDNPAELIGSKKMEALVHELKSRYSDRYVIFDSTPLLATSESEVLSKLVDGIILVIRAGTTAREIVKQAISSIDKGKILGSVLNDLQFKSSGLSSRYFGSDEDYNRYSDGKIRPNLRNRRRKFPPGRSGKEAS